MVIGLTGLIGSGKSEVARHLMERYGFVRIKFADPLKNMLRSLLREVGLDVVTIERMIEGDLKEVPCEALSGCTPRHAMITLGTEWGRNCLAKELWVHVTKLKIKAALKAGQSVVLDDCRFVNEAAMVTDLGGEVWRIDRGQLLAVNHESETGQALVPVQKRIQNDGSLFDLRRKIDAQLRY